MNESGKRNPLGGVKFWYKANNNILIYITFQPTVELVEEVVPSLPNPGVWTMDQSSSLLSLNNSFWNKNKIAASVGSKRVRVLFSRNVFIL